MSSKRKRRGPGIRQRQVGAIKRVPLFAGLCVLGVGTVAGYIFHVKSRNALPPAEVPEAQTPAIPEQAPPLSEPPAVAQEDSPAVTPAPNTPASTGPATTAPVAAAEKPAKAVPPKAAFAPSRIFFRHNGVEAHYGKVAYVSPDKPNLPQFVDSLSCEVVYVAGGEGICLSAKRGVITRYSARIFNASTFVPHAQFEINGVPSRARVSIDGKLAAFTVFVAGHGYTTLDFSTQTLIVNTTNGEPIADLETFDVTRDGKPFKETDFNFWGVTFTPDAREFYATLSSAGKHFLIHGNIAERTAKVIHENVECPSLSPDGTRVAYKKRFIIDNRIVWQLHVLDLATGKETALAEKRSIDDQLEWLDEHTVLYSVPETADDSSPSTDVWRAAADGRSQPRLYLHKAYSPAAVR